MHVAHSTAGNAMVRGKTCTHHPRHACVLECPKGSICQPTRGMAPNVRFKKLHSRAGEGGEGQHRRLPGLVPAVQASGLRLTQAQLLAGLCHFIAWQAPPVPARGLVDHAHIVRRRLVVLHVPAVDKLQLCRKEVKQRPLTSAATAIMQQLSTSPSAHKQATQAVDLPRFQLHTCPSCTRRVTSARVSSSCCRHHRSKKLCRGDGASWVRGTSLKQLPCTSHPHLLAAIDAV